MAETMKAVGAHGHLETDHPESFVDLRVDRPRPTGRDLLVQVRAVSVNPLDTKVRRSRPHAESTPMVLGWDAAGVVVAAGEDCTLFHVGDEVYYAGSIHRPGTNSEFHLVDERIVGRKPRTTDFAQAASLPLTTLTAWEACFDRLGVCRQPEQNAGKSILIIGAAGGVGSVATQLARNAGLTVIGTASRPETMEWALAHGAHHTIDHREAFAPQLLAVGFPAVDYVFCLNDTAGHWDTMVQAVAPQGKICSIVSTKLPVDLSQLQQKSATFAWEWMFTRPVYQTADMIEQHRSLDAMADMVDAGVIVPTLSEHLSPINAQNLRRAHTYVESGKAIGKMVLSGF